MELWSLFVTLGVISLAGLAADTVGQATRLPRVTMLLLLGVVAGQAGFGVIPVPVVEWFDELSVLALSMVAFLLGGSLTGAAIRAHGAAILWISVSIVGATLVVVTLGLWLAGMELGLALLLAAIATATAPAAMADVLHQAGVENGFTETLKGVVAIDDAWGLIVFSVVLVLVGQSGDWGGMLAHAGRDLGGAIGLGLAIGVPGAVLTGRLKPGEPMQAEAIGIVLLTAGLALWLEVSFLVAGMVAGAVIANLARHHDRAFHEIEHIQWPFLILFFLLAGATLDVDALLALGGLGVLFLVLRVLARGIGGYLGARLGGVPRWEAALYGPALLPQAGVAVGMALVAGEALPDWAAVIMAFTLASTVVFEILAPPVTLWAVRRSEVVQGGAPED